MMTPLVGVIMFLAVTCPTVLGESMPESTSPGPGYEEIIGQGLYKLHATKKTWHEAMSTCEDEGSHLAIINSNEEAYELKRLMGRHREVNYGVCGCSFIGFHDLSREGHFITVLGEPLNSTGFLKWGPNNPDNTGNNEDCGALTFRGDLNDLSCTETYPFICEHPTDYNKTSSGIAVNLHPMYERYPDLGSYKLHTEPRSWIAAKQVCNDEGAYLAIVNSNAESDVFRKMLGRNPNLELGDGQSAFVGIYDKNSDGNFFTVFDDPLASTGFKEWSPNSLRNGAKSAGCGGITRNGRLNTMRCISVAPFFCERYNDDDETFNKPTMVPDMTDWATADGFTLYPGIGSYKLHMDVKDWHEAKRVCENENAFLAIINSVTEANTLKDMVEDPNIDMKNYWSILLGFNDVTTEGHFVTVFGKPLESTGYVQWFESNPDNYGSGEDCGGMKRNGKLNDVSCNMRLPFFCERDIGVNHNAMSSRRLSISPEHAHVRQESQVSIMCQSDEPLIECHFKLVNRPLYDLSLGENSRSNASYLNGDISSYRYNGRGLQEGQCGIVITLGPGLHRKVVGCRGRAVRGGWKYGYMTLQASNSPAVEKISTPPSEIIASLTEDSHFLWQTNTPITWCKFILPTTWTETVFTDPTLESTDEAPDSSEESEIFFGGFRPEIRTGKDASYFGHGFSYGDCGVSLPNSPKWNGYVWCGLGLKPSWEWRASAMIFPKAPNSPLLQVNAAEHSEGAILQAECVVDGSRPVAKITWYLGDDVIRQDDQDDSPIDTWTWPYDEQTITQKLTRQLKAEDNGKELVCEASHSALPTGKIRSSRFIIIERSILNRTFDVDEYGFEVGKQAFISVVVTASPRPVLTWHFDDVTIPEGGQDPSGRFFAEQAAQMDSLAINWVAKLTIAKVTEEDFQRDFFLTTKNIFGAQAYKIDIHKGGSNVNPQGGKSDVEATTRAVVPATTTRTRATTTTTRLREPTTSTTQRTTTRTRTTTTTTTMKTTPARTTVKKSWYTTLATHEHTTTKGGVEITNAAELTTTKSTGADTTENITENTTSGVHKEIGRADVLQSQTEASDSMSGGAITGIVFAILILHVSLAAILIYGRRSGWWCIPGKTHVSAFIRPTMSMDNLLNEDGRVH